MLRLKTFGYLHLPTSPLKSLLFSPTHASLVTSRPFPSLSFASSKHQLTPIAFSATSAPTAASSQSPMAPTTTVEHVVLFKVKEGIDSSKIDAMISNLQSLISLDVVSHLVAVPILRNRSSAFQFTHLLHSRYKTKPDLATYSDHPAHRAVVKDFVLPIVDDILAVDWEADLESGDVVLRSGVAARLTLAKPKEEAGEEGIMAVLRGIRSSFPGIEQVSYGVNFSPARAKGFAVGFLSVFPGLEELDALDNKGELLEVQKENVRPLLESVIVVDFVVPSSPSASL